MRGNCGWIKTAFDTFPTHRSRHGGLTDNCNKNSTRWCVLYPSMPGRTAQRMPSSRFKVTRKFQHVNLSQPSVCWCEKYPPPPSHTAAHLFSSTHNLSLLPPFLVVGVPTWRSYLLGYVPSVVRCCGTARLLPPAACSGGSNRIDECPWRGSRTLGTDQLASACLALVCLIERGCPQKCGSPCSLLLASLLRW